MKKFVILLSTLMILSLAISAKVPVLYMGDIQAKATPEDTKNLKKYMDSMKWSPAHKEPGSGKQIFRVDFVEKGSFYEREGIKAGDLFYSGRSQNSKP